VSNQSHEYRESRINVDPVDSGGFTEADRTTYIESLREVIDLDVVVVTSSGNIDVSPCFLRPATVIDAEIIRMHRLVSPLQPTQHC